jgi:raffinose/stachyose/melibiose transport system permease protein
MLGHLSVTLKELGLLLFIVPSLAFICLLAYFPAISAVYHSFFMWSGGEDKIYVGLGHFERILHDTIFLKSFITIGILAVANVIKLIPSIIMAVLIHRLASERSQYWYRIMVVIPMVVPSIVTLFIWKFFFDPNLGPLNMFLNVTGLMDVLNWVDGVFGWGLFVEGQPVAWLSESRLILPALILWGFPWLGSVGVLIYLAGLAQIDASLYESADLDGCGPFRKFFHIELPLILTQVRLTLILLIIGTFQSFGQQYLLLGENGGPQRAGMTPGLWMFNRAFFNSEFGYACALGMVLFLVILILTLINEKFVRIDK